MAILSIPISQLHAQPSPRTYEIVIRDTGVSIDATDSNFSAIGEAQGDRRGAECVFDLQTDNRAVLEQT